MAFRKVKDLAVKVSSYTDRNGQEKGRWKNVGAVLKNEKGETMIMLDRSFNPAGVPFKDGSDQIAISVFDLRDDDRQAAPAPAPAPAPSAADDDIPF